MFIVTVLTLNSTHELSPDSSPPPYCQLNFSSLLFYLPHSGYALNYYQLATKAATWLCYCTEGSFN